MTCHRIALGLLVATAISWSWVVPCAAAEGDFDANGFVDLVDFTELYTCLSVSGPAGPPVTGACAAAFDFDADTDVDLADFAAFGRSLGHLPIPLRDTLGNVLAVDSTTPYSGRQTCGGFGGACHDLDDPAGITNGFHFQQGRTDPAGNIITQNDYFGDGRWWHQSPSRYGLGWATTYRYLAAKENTNESQLDVTTFRWVGECGGCHVGGGQGEFDRDGLRLWNEATGQFGFELLGKTWADVQFDGDYCDSDHSGNWSQARWDITGLAETDCLQCHCPDPEWNNGQNINRRTRRHGTLQAMTNLVDDANQPVPAYAAAGVAGQGWFSNIEYSGSVATRLQIDYSVGVGHGTLVQNPDNTLALPSASVNRPPRDNACWMCHGPFGFKMSRGATWFDDQFVHFRKFTNRNDEDPTNDIPVEKSTVCVVCHPGNLEHNFAKGNSMNKHFRDEHDWVGFRSCRECHLTVLPNGAPNLLKHPDSPAVPGDVRVHQIGFFEGENGPMAVLSCQFCHIPSHPLGLVYHFKDNTVTGNPVSYWKKQFYSSDPINPTDPDKSRWYPDILPKTDSDGVTRLFPTNIAFILFWADWDQNGTPGDLTDDKVAPINLWRIVDITGGAPLPGVADDNGDGKLELNRPEEILTYIQALKGNDHYGRQVAANPVLVKAKRVYHEDPQAPGGVNSFEHVGTGMAIDPWTGHLWEVDHNVPTADNAYGAGEDCQVCHRTDGQSPVFDRLILTDPWGTDGQPIYETVREMTGANTTSYHDNIVLKDAMGSPLTVASTAPYSGRQTCSGATCHDVDRISNGIIHQQGRTDADGNIVMQDDFLGTGQWWVRSSGMFGRWSGGGGGLNRQTAGKDNASESTMDMTAFYGVANCGGCHAGGGGLEFDRDGIRYWDQATGQFGYEVLGQGPGDVVLDGDYAYVDVDNDAALSPAPWDVTGVAEPECLHCHRANRNYVAQQDMHREWRAEVLSTKDQLVDDLGQSVPAYAAAGTAGQGWFSTLDTAANPPVLQVDYSVGVGAGDLTVNANSELVLATNFIARPPRDEACWGCHLPGGFQGKRGTVWFDERDVMYAGFNNLRDEDPNNDIPPDLSTTCNHCHPGNIDHNFAKGDSPYARFRNNSDWVGFRSCRECHLVRIDGQPNPLKDPTAPDVGGGSDPNQIHFAGTGTNGPMEKVSCQGCHVPYALERANMVTDRSLTGTAVTYLTDEFLSANPIDPTDPDKSTWHPALVWKTDSDGQQRLFPQKKEVAIYWADWDDMGTPGDFTDDRVQPIILWRVRQITGNQPLSIVTDDNADGKLEVNRPAEILLYMKALKGNDSYGRQVAANPVLIKGERVWYEDSEAAEDVSWFEHEGAGLHVESFETFGLDHNVLDKTEAWGAGFPPFCDDCHRGDGQSPVFDRLILVDPFDETGQPLYRTVRDMTGAVPPPT
ncbi:MAG: hypothetical protein GY778_16860 [bacterium]|nr:hypothetical protein [bacterium]